MSKIKNTEVVCACCGKNVEIKRIYSSFSSQMGLGGNHHNPIQFRLEECPECHYTSIDIEDTRIHVTEDMLESFRMDSQEEKITDHDFVSLLRASYIYEKNNLPLLQAQMMRLAGFYAEEKGEESIAREIIRRADDILIKYFEKLEEYTIDDINLAVELIDDTRRQGLAITARRMCNDILAMLEGADELREVKNIRKLILFEKLLIDKKDKSEHMIGEVL